MFVYLFKIVICAFNLELGLCGSVDFFLVDDFTAEHFDTAVKPPLRGLHAVYICLFVHFEYFKI